MPSIHRRRRRTIKAPLGTGLDASSSLAKGLVAAYMMNEAGGSSLLDLSGNRNTATLSAFSWGEGRFGRALVTNNANSYAQVTVPNGASLDITGNGGISWGGWCYPTASNVYQCIQGKIINSTSRQYASYLSGNGTGQIYAALNGVSGLGNAGNNFIISTPWAVNAWNHVICTYDGSTFTIYLNGRSVYSSAQSGSITNAGSNWYLGYEPTSATFPFKGSLDIQVVYSRALAAAEVMRLFADPLALFAPPATRRYASPTGSTTVTLSPAGLATSEAWGSAALSAAAGVAPAGVATSEAWGASQLAAAAGVVPAAVGTSERWGSVVVAGGVASAVPTHLYAAADVVAGSPDSRRTSVTYL